MTTQAERAEMTPAQKIEAWAAEYGVTMDATFIPMSVAKVKHPDRFEPVGGRPWQGLTWDIQLKRAGRLFLEMTYSAGVAHCPGYKLAKREGMLPREWERHREALCAWECENGRPGRYASYGGIKAISGDKIMPEFASVLHSLSMDASVINEGPFEDWAASLGYDPDSRKAEAIHRACLDVALKARGALGERGLEALAEAAQDY